MTAIAAIDLGAIDVASVLQLAESEGLSGALHIADLGTLELYNGEVVDASCRAMSGLDAALALLMEASGTGRLEQRDSEPRPVLMPAMALFIEGARLTDDWKQLAPRRLAADVDVDELHDRLSPLLPLLDGEHTVDEAVRAAGAERVEVLDALLDGVQAGILFDLAEPAPDRVQPVRAERPVNLAFASSAAPQPTIPVAPQDSDEDFFDLLDASRRALRQREYDDALGLIERAHALRPDDRTVAQNLRRLRQLTSQRG